MGLKAHTPLTQGFMEKRDDMADKRITTSTIARMAGDIAAGLVTIEGTGYTNPTQIAEEAIDIAQAIVARVESQGTFDTDVSEIHGLDQPRDDDQQRIGEETI